MSPTTTLSDAVSLSHPVGPEDGGFAATDQLDDAVSMSRPVEDAVSFSTQLNEEEAAKAAKDLGPVGELKWLDQRNKNLEILPKDDWKRRDELIGNLGMWERFYDRNLAGVGDALAGLGTTIATMTGELWKEAKGVKEDPQKTLMKLQMTSVEGALRGSLDFTDLAEATIKHLAGALDVYVLGAGDTDKQTEDLHYEHYVEQQKSRINRANINRETAVGTLAGGTELMLAGSPASAVKTQQTLQQYVMPATSDVLGMALNPMNAAPISFGGRVGTMMASFAARGGAMGAGKVATLAGMMNRTLNFGTRAEALIARAAPNMSQTAVKRLASTLSATGWTGATYVAGDILEDTTGVDVLKKLSYAYGAARVGLASTAVGAGALQAILAQTAQGPRWYSTLQRLSRTPGTPMFGALAARTLDPFVTPVARAARAGVGGAATGAAFGAAIGVATGVEMPEVAGSAAVGAAIGLPLGMIGHGLAVKSGADADARMMHEVAITRETQRALNGDAAAELFEKMPFNEQLATGMIQAVGGPTAVVEILGAAEFAKRHGTSAGVHIDNKTPGVLPRIVINAEAKRPAGQTVLHEFGHELARQIAPEEIKSLFEEFATPEEKTAFGDEYLTRTVETRRKAGELPDVPGVAEFGKQMAEVKRQLDESQPGWLEQEWFAEKSVQSFYAANWRDVLAKGDKADVAKWAGMSLRSKRAVLENAGVAFDHAGNVIEPNFISESFKGQGDEQLTKTLYQYLKERGEYSPVLDATVDRNARADAGRGPAIDFGRTFQRLKTHPAFKGTYEKNPRTGLMENEFSVQMPDGSIVLKNEKDVRAAEKTEAVEMQKVFATPPVDPDSPLVGPRRILDDNGQPTTSVQGQELPKSYYDSTKIPVRQKTKARAVQDVMMDGRGETIDMLYHQIGSEGGKASWATAVKQKLGNVRATFRTVRPINFFVSKANNLLARVVDVTAYNAKLLRATEEATLAEWHNNAELFDADVKKVMANWATGAPGSSGLETAKFLRIMDFLGKEGGRNSLIKSFRIDRMEDVKPTGRGGWTFDYGKFKSRAAPSPSPSPAPDVTVRPSPDVPGRPRERVHMEGDDSSGVPRTRFSIGKAEAFAEVDDAGQVVVTGLKVPESMAGRGSGHEILKAVREEFPDETMILRAKPFGKRGRSQAELEGYYEKLGFVKRDDGMMELRDMERFESQARPEAAEPGAKAPVAVIKRDMGENAEFAIPPGEERARESLEDARGVKRAELFGVARETKPGTPVGVRIDIPTFRKSGDYVQVVHQKAGNQKVEGEGGKVGKVIGYDTHVVLDGPGKFFVDEVKAEQIKLGTEKLARGERIDEDFPEEGRHKTPVATAEGAYGADQTIPQDLGDWTAAGFDPVDHSFYYDKATDQMITGWKGKPGEPSAYSVGNTVFLKDPIYATKPKRAAARYSPDVSNEGSGRQTTGNPEFYSSLHETLDKKIQGRAAQPDQVMGMVRAPGSGVKAEEIKWSGLEQAVQRIAAENGGKVPKDQLMAYLRGEGAATFKERRYESKQLLEHPTRARSLLEEDLISRMEEESSLMLRKPAGSEELSERYALANAASHLIMGNVDIARAHLRLAPRTPLVEKMIADLDALPPKAAKSKYDAYTITGGENYREVVVGLPPESPFTFKENPASAREGKWEVLTPGGSVLYEGFRSRQQAQEFAFKAPRGKERNFQSPHFPEEPNYLAHYRANERPDSSGSPGLFVEEFQSDRHQKGRKEGYKGEQPTGGVPDAPFRKAEAWAPMLFKRALRDAVEAGKKWIGWTTGKTQNARYDLTQHFSEINIGRDKDGFYFETRQFPDELHEGMEIAKDRLSQAALAEHVGERLASKAAAELEVGADPKRYTGVDLEMGGEGMKGFYDQMLPKEIGKYVKQWGAKVEPGEIGRKAARIVPYVDGYVIKVGDEITSSQMSLEMAKESLKRYREAEGEATPIWQVKITPEMAKGVKAGRQPMFSPDVPSRMTPEEVLQSRDATRQRIDAALSKAGIDTGGTAKAVLREPDRKIAIQDPAGYKDDIVPFEAIRREADRLVDRARDDGFLWDPEVEQAVRSELGRSGGGAEHDVWVMPDKTNPMVLRSRTVAYDDNPRLTDTSPSLYLERLDDYNTLFPEIPMEVVGVSRTNNGDTKIWTAQPFVEGKEFKSQAMVAKAMEANGWVQHGDLFTWKDKQTGAVIGDVHRGNLLVDKAGKIWPIDVIPKEMGTLAQQAPVTRASPDVGVGRHKLGAERETRVVGEAEAVRLTRAERKEIKLAAKSATPKETAIKAAALEESIRETKARFPVEDGWKGPIEFTGLDPAGKPDYKVMPYEFNRGRGGKALKKGTKQYNTQVTALGSRMRDVVQTVFDRAQAGSEAAQKILSQASWYREMRTRLRREFGGLGDLFADLLGATSPNTPVRTNWNFATDSMRRALRGDFDDLIPQWEQWVNDVDVLRDDLRGYVTEQLGAGRTKVSLTGKDKVTNKKTGVVKEAVPGDPVYLQKLEALEDRAKLGDALLPTQESGANYGFNGRNVVRAMVDLWRTVRAPEPIMGEGGTAPKALNFSGNLIGFRPGATIDVWAARMLQRLAGHFRIPIPTEGSVTGRMLPSGETTHAFGMGQDVFAHATELIRGDATLSTHETLKNINPDDLQAIVWFVEKELWTRNNWTSQEGGSFEFEADLAGVANQKRVNELRKIIDSERTTPAAKAEATAELDTMKRELDRFVGGLAIERSAGIQGEAYVPTNADQARTAEQLHTAVYQSDAGNNVIGVKAASTEGRYGAVERAIDLEVVAREGYDPNPLWEQMREIADREKQDTTFLARILRSEEKIDPLFHRAGVEIFFRTSKTGEAMEAAIQKLHDMGAGFHTIVVDARPTTKAKAGEMPPAVGVRILRLPEYDVRFGMDRSWTGMDDAGIAAKVKQSHDELVDLGRELMVNNPDVNLANAGYYEVRTEFAHEYAGIQPNRPPSGTAGSPRQTPWRGRPVREAVDAANIRHAGPAGAP